MLRFARFATQVAIRHAGLLCLSLVVFASSTAAQSKSATVPKSAIPTPESVFGFKAGADSSLFLYDQSIEYCST
jgi:hypothetical protein